MTMPNHEWFSVSDWGFHHHSQKRIDVTNLEATRRYRDAVLTVVLTSGENDKRLMPTHE